MTINLEQFIKAQIEAQTVGMAPESRPDLTAYRLAIVKREVTTRFARAYRRAFYEGEIVVAEVTTVRRVTAWSLANRCATVLAADDVAWITPAMIRAIGQMQQATGS